MKEKVEKIVSGVASGVDATVETAIKKTDQLVSPYRQTFFQKFPTASVFLVTFGVTTTFLGFEKIITTIPWLHERPWLILGMGIMTLMLTGTLYKKLG
ncbi:MAG: hypothetical protein LR017_03300 [Candidatus Pacebacteria bacterium]|nr:hypothetical protein [Candidatus Paceibacterota bacterium]